MKTSQIATPTLALRSKSSLDLVADLNGVHGSSPRAKRAGLILSFLFFVFLGGCSSAQLSAAPSDCQSRGTGDALLLPSKDSHTIV